MPPQCEGLDGSMSPIRPEKSEFSYAGKTEEEIELEKRVPWLAAMTTYFGYAILMLFGWIRDTSRAHLPTCLLPKLDVPTKVVKEGYAPLLIDFEDFYTRRLYRRIKDCWNRPISSNAGAWVDVMERTSDNCNVTETLTGKTLRSFNLGSYNYLGFGDPTEPYISHVVDSLKSHGVALASPRSEFGTCSEHVELEKYVASYLKKPAALTFGMGFATNSTVIPALMGKGCLIISDTLNHSSIITGARSSGAKTVVFKHNDPADLEKVLRKNISEGQPRSHRPWKKILIVVEGIYSMEGEFCRLPEIVAIKKKYKASLWLDEAHSIGALGSTGRGCSEELGVDTADIDVMMGTFTKSFGSVGGYIAASEDVIRYLKHASPGYLYATGISPACANQAITALKVIAGDDGTNLGAEKLQALRDNTRFFREKCVDMGLQVFGDMASPVVPVMLYNPAKMPAFSRECLKRNVAVVVVGFPATPLLESRVRFCISASHTREDLEKALEAIDEVSDIVMIKYNHTPTQRRQRRLSRSGIKKMQ